MNPGFTYPGASAFLPRSPLIRLYSALKARIERCVSEIWNKSGALHRSAPLSFVTNRYSFSGNSLSKLAGKEQKVRESDAAILVQVVVGVKLAFPELAGKEQEIGKIHDAIAVEIC